MKQDPVIIAISPFLCLSLSFRIFTMSSHNSKYYCKSVKTNKVDSKKITSMFKRKIDDVPDNDHFQNAQAKTPCIEHEQEAQATSHEPVQGNNMIMENDEFEDNDIVSDKETSVSTPAVDVSCKDTNATSDYVDLRVTSLERYQNKFPDFYYCIVRKGWYCKTCISFSGITGGKVPFITAPATFGEHPTRRVKKHLTSERHVNSAKNKAAYDALSRKRTNVWKMLIDAKLATEIQQSNADRFIIKCFFRITHLLIKQHWGHTHNFKNLVELIAECGGREIKTHLLTAPKNAVYISPPYIAKYIDIMNNYLKEPLLASLQSGKYTLYNDETQDITSIEQMAIYATFKHNGSFSEHYVGIMPISQLVQTHLSAANILEAMKIYLEGLNVSLRNGRFFCMDTTNVNSGERGGLKRLLKHAVPLATWVGCGNHKVALCFKHLLKDFPDVFSADATLLALWKYFHYRPLALNFMKNAAEMYDEHAITPVCPSVTRWTAHDRACKSLCDGFQQNLAALSVCVNERKEPDALGVFNEITSPRFMATILMLRDVFSAVQPLNLTLQKGHGSLCLADLPFYLERTLNSLEKLISTPNRHHFTKENHDKMLEKSITQTESLPPSSRTRSRPFDFDEFEAEVFLPFVNRFSEEVKEAFKQLDFWLSFVVFDPRKLPETKAELSTYGGEEIEKLSSHYGSVQTDTYQGQVSTQEADFDKTKLVIEWGGFKDLMFERRRYYQMSIDRKIVKASAGEERTQLQKERSAYTPTKLWKDLQTDTICNELYQSCIYLLELSLMFPLSVACVERLFSKMKLIKTRLRNQLGQTTLDSLLRISTESPDAFQDDEFEFFANELKRLNPNMRMKY